MLLQLTGKVRAKLGHLSLRDMITLFTDKDCHMCDFSSLYLQNLVLLLTTAVSAP